MSMVKPEHTTDDSAATTAARHVERVVFVQKFVPHYRAPFFERLRASLAERGIELVLVCGQPDPFEGSKVRVEYPDWAQRVKSRIVRFRGRYLYWQQAWRHVRRGDLVVVEHAAKLLDNYLLYALSRVGYLHFGYFGHGENFLVGGELGLSRFVKKAMLCRVARWFAYTEVSRRSLERQGVDEALISVVNNTLLPPDIDAAWLHKKPTDFVYIGGLYEDKRIDLLLDSATRVAAATPGFVLHVVGTGPLRETVEAAARQHTWLNYHGSLYGEQRNRLLGSCAAIMMPGAVGLVAIDAFHFRCPIITIDAHAHGPEIAYLEHDVNALLDARGGDVESYTALVSRFIEQGDLAERLQAGCAASAGHYSMDAMVERFRAGVEQVHPRGTGR